MRAGNKTTLVAGGGGASLTNLPSLASLPPSAIGVVFCYLGEGAQRRQEQMYKIWPIPWEFEWRDYPVVRAANGRVVCVLPTGALEGPLEVEDIVALGERIALFAAPKMKDDAPVKVTVT